MSKPQIVIAVQPNGERWEYSRPVYERWLKNPFTPATWGLSIAVRIYCLY